MIQWDRIELIVVAVAGAVLGGIAGIVLGHEQLGVLIWALAGAIVVSGVVYCLRFFSSLAHLPYPPPQARLPSLTWHILSSASAQFAFLGVEPKTNETEDANAPAVKREAEEN